MILRIDYAYLYNAQSLHREKGNLEKKLKRVENWLTHKTDFLLTPETSSQIFCHFLWSLNDFFSFLLDVFLYYTPCVCIFLADLEKELCRAARDTRRQLFHDRLLICFFFFFCFFFFLVFVVACRPAVHTQSMAVAIDSYSSLYPP